MPPQPVHRALRPWADPRVDPALFVRYDPQPDRKTGAIVIVVPGGNYDECTVHGGEGQAIAQWLNTLGITGVVLKYRCVSRGHYWPAQFEDWRDCAQVVVAEAKSWGCDPKRVGVIGFSAGGHLAAHAALRGEGSLRPGLQVLVYPAIDTLSPHENGACDPWYPEKGYPPPETCAHLLVTPSTPPAFLVGIEGDQYCPSNENTDVYAKALDEKGVPYRYVKEADWEHGCGLQDWWTVPCAEWLAEKGWARIIRTY